MASYHRILKVFGRSVEDKTLQCDCDIHPWEIRVNGHRWSGRIRLIGFVDVFFLISYSENSRFDSGIVIYKDDVHTEKILKHAGKNPEDFNLLSKNSKPTSPPASASASASTPKPEQKIKYTSFASDTVDYTVTSVGHPVGLRTKYTISSLEQYTIQLRKPQDPLLKRKYKKALKQHDTLDMIQDAVKLGFVSYAEILGHGIGHIYRGGSTLDVGKGFVGGLGGSQQRGAGLSGDKA